MGRPSFGWSSGNLPRSARYGQTFVARKLATVVAGDRDRVELVQFHPSYAYEDFVEGYRPTGTGAFSVKSGPLKRFAARANESPNKRFVLLIDEINHVNCSPISAWLNAPLRFASWFLLRPVARVLTFKSVAPCWFT